MSDLDDEIARIAALRGRSVEDVLATAAQERLRQQRVSEEEIRDLFHVPDGPTEADLDHFDNLPRKLRTAIFTCPLMISATKVAMLRGRGADTRSIIAGIDDQLPGMLARGARQRYGNEHPAAKELTS